MPTQWWREPWRKLYTKLDAQWLGLTVSARGLADELIKYADETGRLFKVDSVAAAGEEIARRLSAKKREYKRIAEDTRDLLDDTYLVLEDGWLVIRNFADAQERLSPAARRQQRDGERDMSDDLDRDEQRDGERDRSDDLDRDEQRDGERDRSDDLDRDEQRDGERDRSDDLDRDEQRDGERDMSDDLDRDEQRDGERDMSRDSGVTNDRDSHRESNRIETNRSEEDFSPPRAHARNGTWGAGSFLRIWERVTEKSGQTAPENLRTAADKIADAARIAGREDVDAYAAELIAKLPKVLDWCRRSGMGQPSFSITTLCDDRHFSRCEDAVAGRFDPDKPVEMDAGGRVRPRTEPPRAPQPPPAHTLRYGDD
jgi:hypothetical protein